MGGKLGVSGGLLGVVTGDDFDPDSDLLFIIGGAEAAGAVIPVLNGRFAPPALLLNAGTRYRLRFINVIAYEPARLALLDGIEPMRWRARARAGAELPGPLRAETPAISRIRGGETFDFEWTPAAPIQAVLEIGIGRSRLQQALRVR